MTHPQTIRTAYDGSLCEELLRELRRFISESSPGRFLPSENQLVMKYHVSRSTANKALNILAKEGLVERQRGRGTLVRPQAVITYLLPCPDFMSWHRPDSETTRLRYSGIMKAAQELNMGVETIAVSRVNDPNVIDFAQLARINAGSKVITDIWFRNLFPLLFERRAQVVMTNKQYIQYGFRQYAKKWHIFEISDKDTIRKVLDILRAQGCRRIGIAGNYLLNSPHLTFNAYCAWADAHGMEQAVMDLNMKHPIPREEIAAWCRSFRLDGLVWNGQYPTGYATIQEMLGIPASIQVFGWNFIQYDHEMEPFPYCVTPFEKIGYDAARLLAQLPHPPPKQRLYSYEFHNLPDNLHS